MTDLLRFLPDGIVLNNDNLNLKGIYSENNKNIFDTIIKNEDIYDNIISKYEYDNINDYAKSFCNEVIKMKQYNVLLNNISLFTNIIKNYESHLKKYFSEKINNLPNLDYDINNLKNIILMCYLVPIELKKNENNVKIIMKTIDDDNINIPINLIKFSLENNIDIYPFLYKYMFNENVDIKKYSEILKKTELDISNNFKNIVSSYYLNNNFNDLVQKNKIRIQSTNLEIPKMDFKLFTLSFWNKLNFSLLYPNIPNTLEIYLKLCSTFLDKKKYNYDIDWTKGYVVLKWKSYKIKVNMLQYLLLEHIKVNKLIKLENVETTLYLHKTISEHILNSLYRANLITININTDDEFILNSNYSPTDDNDIINAISFFNSYIILIKKHNKFIKTIIFIIIKIELLKLKFQKHHFYNNKN